MNDRNEDIDRLQGSVLALQGNVVALQALLSNVLQVLAGRGAMRPEDIAWLHDATLTTFEGLGGGKFGEYARQAVDRIIRIDSPPAPDLTPKA